MSLILHVTAPFHFALLNRHHNVKKLILDVKDFFFFFFSTTRAEADTRGQNNPSSVRAPSACASRP